MKKAGCCVEPVMAAHGTHHVNIALAATLQQGHGRTESYHRQKLRIEQRMQRQRRTGGFVYSS